MQDSPLFSIILPVYNVSPYIERCIISLQNQTFKDFEMIFVDDCGQDDSMKIVETFVKKDNRIKLIANPKNLGTYHARHNGVKNANGEYIVFLDPDDELDACFLSKFIQHLENKKDDLIFFGIQNVPKNKFYHKPPRMLPLKKTQRVLEAIQKRNGKKTVWAGAAGKAYKKDFLKKVYGKLNIDPNFRYVYTEDKLLYYAALLENPSYSSLAYNGYIYHNNQTSITNKKQLTNVNVLIEQLIFTTEKLKDLTSTAHLTKKEKSFFAFFLNESVLSQISMMKRFENDGNDYLQNVFTAFKTIPSVTLFIRIMLHIISFKKIKL